MTLKVITPPAVEPVTLAETKLHLRVTTSADDDQITALITTARELVEQSLSRALISQTLELVLDSWPGSTIILPRPPLVSVTSIVYTDDAAADATFASTNYLVDADSTPGRIRLKSGKTWPSTTLQDLNAVRVRYVAGYGAAGTNVPQPIRQAILLLIGDWYENREATIVAQGMTATPLPNGVEALLWPYRIVSF